MNEIRIPVEVVGYENRKSSKDGSYWCTVYCVTNEVQGDGQGRQVYAYSLHKECMFEIGCQYDAMFRMVEFGGNISLRIVDIR